MSNLVESVLISRLILEVTTMHLLLSHELDQTDVLSVQARIGEFLSGESSDT